MENLNFTFNEELFGALRKDWKTLATVEYAIEHFLNDDDVEEIRVNNEEDFYRRDDFNVRLLFKDEYLILEIYDDILHQILLPIEHDKKLVLKKRGSVAYVELE